MASTLSDTTDTSSTPPSAAHLSAGLVEEGRLETRRWAAIAIGSLLAAGVLSLFLVLGRLPPLDALFTDVGFFHRALVVHVVLAIVVWFLAFIVALFHLLPTVEATPPTARLAPHLAFLGLLAMGASTALPEATPILANYIPVLDHPLFLGGLILFGVSVIFALLGPRLLPGAEVAGHGSLPAAARPGLRAAALAALLGALTLLSSWWSLSTSEPADLYYERLVWGAGHVLQFASVAAMVAVWLILLTPILGRAPIGRRGSALLFALLVTPLFVAPILADTSLVASRLFFTRLMELAIFPVVSVFLIACLVALIRRPRPGDLEAGALFGAARWKAPGTQAFLASAALTLLGFGLGAAIDGSNTLVPAHYHAAIGAVTVAFMAATHALGPRFGLAPYRPRARRLAAWQPLLFGAGQIIFAAGFAIAGAAGMGRKTYGAEQAIATDATAKTVGLVVMGVGGFIAIVGGLLFLGLVTAAWRRSRGPRVHDDITPTPPADGAHTHD